MASFIKRWLETLRGKPKETGTSDQVTSDLEPREEDVNLVQGGRGSLPFTG